MNRIIEKHGYNDQGDGGEDVEGDEAVVDGVEEGGFAVPFFQPDVEADAGAEAEINAPVVQQFQHDQEENRGKENSGDENDDFVEQFVWAV